MNRILLLIGLFTAVAAAAAPVLEISEFGKKVPVIRERLSGKEQIFSGTSWNCRVKKKKGQLTVWELNFTGSRHEPVRLAVKFTSPVTFTPRRFWDGNKEHKVEKLPLKRDDFLEAFPLAAAEDGSRGAALGFAPETILSGFRRMLTSDALELETRIAVDDRRGQKLAVVEYAFTPEFGWRNAVEDYHNAFPAWFRPVSGVDRRIYGVSGYLSGAHMQRPFELHSARFTGIRWEWTYAPWYASGFWYPVGDGWKTEKNEWRNYFRIRAPKMLTRTEYDDAVRKEMYWGNKAAAMFYYILVKDIHQDLANSYPQAVQGSSGLHSLPSNRGKTKSVFAPGTPLFDYLKNQLRQVVENYEVSGFSFDMANSSYHFTTPSQLEYAVGRSWYDDGKIYTSDTVAPIPFSDYIHTLKRNGKTMGTVFNAALGKFSPFTMFHCDGAIMEGPPHYNLGIVLPLRLTMGRKPLTFWHFMPDNSAGVMTDFIAGDPERKERVRRGLRLFYLHKCYELGINPMNWEVDDSWRIHLPVLRALSEAGYHPVSAVKGAEPFRTGRFGDGVGTLITFSNPKRKKITRTVKVLTRHLGKGKFAFLPTQGKLRQRIAEGETVFELALAPKEIVVLRSIAVEGGISELTAETAGKDIVLAANGAFSFRLPDADPAGNRLAGGRDGVFSGRTEGRVRLIPLAACGIFAKVPTMTALLDDGSFPSVEAGSAADTQTAAEMVAMYRPHVKASRLSRGTVNNREPGFMSADLCKPDLVIAAPGRGKAGKRICLGTPADFPAFTVPENFAGPFLAMPDAETLWIGGRTPQEVGKAANVYFAMLDKCRTAVPDVDFKHPEGWGGNEKFVQGDGQKYLRIAGDPARKDNNWRYEWYPLTEIKGGDEITFTVSCKAEKITSGKILLGIYEFSDGQARKHLRFAPVELKAAPGWQTVSGKIKLRPETRSARFYFLCRGLGKGDVFTVRSLKLVNHSK